MMTNHKISLEKRKKKKLQLETLMSENSDFSLCSRIPKTVLIKCFNSSRAFIVR